MPEGRPNNEPAVQQAQKLVDDLGRRGVILDYSPASLAELEKLLSNYPRGWSEAHQTMALLSGAYFGEVVRRNMGGQWYDQIPPHNTTGLLVNEENQLMTFPYSITAKRLREGGQTLPQAYERLGGMSKLKMNFQLKQPDAPQG